MRSRNKPFLCSRPDRYSLKLVSFTPMLRFQFSLWIAASVINGELIAYATCRIMGKLLDYYNELWMITTMMAATAPFAVVIGFVTFRVRHLQ